MVTYFQIPDNIQLNAAILEELIMRECGLDSLESTCSVFEELSKKIHDLHETSKINIRDANEDEYIEESVIPLEVPFDEEEIDDVCEYKLEPKEIVANIDEEYCTSHEESESIPEYLDDTIDKEEVCKFENGFQIFSNPLCDEVIEENHTPYCHGMCEKDFHVFSNPLYDEEEKISDSMDNTNMCEDNMGNNMTKSRDKGPQK